MTIRLLDINATAEITCNRPLGTFYTHMTSINGDFHTRRKRNRSLANSGLFKFYGLSIHVQALLIYRANELAAKSFLASLLTTHDTMRGADNTQTESTKDLRYCLMFNVNTTTGFRFT